MVALSLLAKKICLKNKVSKRIERTAGQNPTDKHRKLRYKKQILFHNQEKLSFVPAENADLRRYHSIIRFTSSIFYVMFLIK